jgi:phosphopantothenoylcysteine synthetase/decarboxylase
MGNPADPAPRPAAPGVLYAVACAAPPVLHLESLVRQAQARGWDVCVILTPSAARWLEAGLARLAALTGHPVRSAYKLPGQPDVLPAADAIVVAPVTANTVNKWAAGISDNLALGLIGEAIGKRVPLVALPFFNAAQAAHPVLPGNLRLLRDAGVTIVPREPGSGSPAEFGWHLALDALTGGPAASP